MKFILLWSVFFLSSVLPAQDIDMERMDAKQSALYLFKNLHEANYDSLWKALPPSIQKKIQLNLTKANRLISNEIRDSFLKTCLHAAETIKLKKEFFVKAVSELDERQKYEQKDISSYLDFVIFTLKKISISNGLRNADAITLCKELSPIVKAINTNNIATWNMESIQKQLSFTEFVSLAQYKAFLEGKIEEVDKGILEVHHDFLPEPIKIPPMKMVDRRWIFRNLKNNTDDLFNFVFNRLRLISENEDKAVKLINTLAGLSKKLRGSEKYEEFKDILKNSVFKQTLVHKSDIDHAAIAREKQYQQLQAVILAKNLKKQLKNKKAKCLVLHHYFFKKNRKQLDEFLKSYKTGFGDSVTEIKSIPIKVYDEKQQDELEFMDEALADLTADDFNKVLKEHQGYDIIISMVSLPFTLKEISKVDFFKLTEDKNGKLVKDPKKKYPLVGVYNGYIGNLEAYFERGLIHAMTIWKPNPKIDEKPLPKDILEAFNKRYLVIRPDNIKTIKAKYPGMFPKFGK